jgi:hypothetical protein
VDGTKDDSIPSTTLTGGGGKKILLILLQIFHLHSKMKGDKGTLSCVVEINEIDDSGNNTLFMEYDLFWVELWEIVDEEDVYHCFGTG